MRSKISENQDHFIENGENIIKFSVLFSKRKTLVVQVYPNMKVIVRSPNKISLSKIKSYVTEKAGWIVKQQRKFQHSNVKSNDIEYKSGEIILYLGKEYTLIIQLDLLNKVIIKDDIIYVYLTKNDKERVKNLLDKWYKEQASIIFKERLELCNSKVEKINIKYKNNLRLRKMKSRWGSCTIDGIITLNTELIKAEMSCIDYVIIHELCHLIEFNHSKKFYQLMSIVMPEWQVYKNKLRQLHLCS